MRTVVTHSPKLVTLKPKLDRSTVAISPNIGRNRLSYSSTFTLLRSSSDRVASCSMPSRLAT
ncbi:hypothetical protein D3C87_2084640 [compost metagenome]